jgi:lactoylglutathione lyase
VFYERLGFEFVAGPLGPEPVAIMRHPCGIEINFILNAARSATLNVLMDAPEKHAGYTHVSLAVRDVRAAKALLEKQGVEITGGPITFDDGATAIFVRDPDRNVIEFNQAAG